MTPIVSPMWSAIVRRDWDQNRPLLADVFALALLATMLLPLDQRIAFEVLAYLLATAVAGRIAGSETMTGTWEFILTRPIDRREWVTGRFLLGLVPLLAMAGWFALGEAVDLHRRLMGWLLDGGASVPAATFDGWVFVLAVAVGVLTYALAYWLVLRERHPERIAWHMASSPPLAIVVSFVIGIVVQLVEGRFPLSDFGADALIVSVLLVALSGGILVLCRNHVARREVGLDPEAAAVAREVWLPGLTLRLMLLIAIAVLVLALVTVVAVVVANHS